jgi:hypothetical protein
MKIAKKEVESGLAKLEAVHSNEQKAVDEAEINIRDHGHTIHSTVGFLDTVYGHATTQIRLQSETADSVTWARYAMHPTDGPVTPLTDALSRIKFTELETPVPLHAIVQSTYSQLESLNEKRSRLLIVAGRSRRLATENHNQELKELMEEYGSVGQEVKKTIGDVATAFVISRCKSGLVVVQAAHIPAI